MRVKLLSLFPLVDAHGEDFTKAETVTLFNDMCILAPATVVDPSIRWRERDARSVGATFSHGPLRLASHGEARYGGPDGEYTYIELDDIHVSYELTP